MKSANLKRFLCLLIALCMTTAVFAGCGKSDVQVDNQSPTDTEVTEPVNQDISYEGYTLKWEDNFDGEELNRNDWNVELHEPGWVNEEWQSYVDSEENIYLEDGKLVLKPVKTVTENGTAVYTSGRVNTQKKHDFKYGLFEARVKVPTGKGYLPAFWLMATDENLYGQWPRCGEIDIMEVMGSDTATAHGTVHYGNPHAQSQGTYKLEEGTFADEYHNFAVEWEPGRIRWYIDGILYHEEQSWHSTTEGQGTITYPAPFDQPFYIILNLAIGGSWVGYPDETTTFEDQSYSIDYVKVYQKDSYDENVKKPAEVYVMRQPDSTGNYIINGDFAVEEPLGDTDNWYFLTAGGGAGSASISNGELTVLTDRAGTLDYSIQLVQPGIPAEKGKTYKVSFDAYSDDTRTLKVCVSAPNRNWIRYLPDTLFEITPEKQSFEFTYTVTADTDPESRLEYNLGNLNSTASFHLSNVRVEEIDSSGDDSVLEEAKTILADGNHVYNGSFQEGDNRMKDWLIAEGCTAEIRVTNENNIRRLMINAPAGTSEDAPVAVYQEKLALSPDAKYSISYRVEGPAGNTVSVKTAGMSFDAELKGSEQTVNSKFTTPDGDFDNDVTILVTQPGVYYFDNIIIEEDSPVKNGSFNAGLASYSPYVDGGSKATYVVDSITEDNAFDITIEHTGDLDWKIQLKQNNINLVKGQWYRLTLDAKCDIRRYFMVALQRDGSIHGDDWTPYCQEIFQLTEEYQKYTIEFEMNPGTAPFSDPNTVLSISMGAVDGRIVTQKHRICIDNIVLEPIEAPVVPEE